MTPCLQEVEEMEVTVSGEGRVESVQRRGMEDHQLELEQMEQQVPEEKKPEPERLEVAESPEHEEQQEEQVEPNDRKDAVTVLQTEEGEGLDSLISVAEVRGGRIGCDQCIAGLREISAARFQRHRVSSGGRD